tara:strand:+ start:440 stop:901 length:462 start_codon:yes stop_codon:yes gene_type:complete
MKFLSYIFNYLNISKQYDEIIPYIFIGDFQSSLNIDFLKEKNIQLIINCSKNCNFINNYKCKKIRIPVDDNKFLKNYDLLKYIGCLNIIDDFRTKQKNILIHCAVGSQRSANILLLYLIKKYNLEYHIAFNIIRSIRPICFFPYNNFNHLYLT